jgi:hypothetical protein
MSEQFKEGKNPSLLTTFFFLIKIRIRKDIKQFVTS